MRTVVARVIYQLGYWMIRTGFFPLTLIALALHTTGCASYSLTPGGEKVYVVAPLSISEVAQYEDLGELSCTGDREICMNNLRNSAAERGAYAIVVTYKCPGDCFQDSKNKNDPFVMKVHAYRKKP